MTSAPEKLSPKARKILIEAEELLLSAISPWEVCKLVAKNRLHLAISANLWIERALDTSRVRLVELSPEISFQSSNLPPPFHDDPADQIIMATARQEGATLITKDKQMRQYGFIRTIW